MDPEQDKQDLIDAGDTSEQRALRLSEKGIRGREVAPKDAIAAAGPPRVVPRSSEYDERKPYQADAQNSFHTTSRFHVSGRIQLHQVLIVSNKVNFLFLLFFIYILVKVRIFQRQLVILRSSSR